MTMNVTDITPAPGASPARGGHLTFNITWDPTDDVRTVLIGIATDEGFETIWDGDGFVVPFSGGSRRTPITGGHSYDLVRSGDWPGGITLTVRELGDAGSGVILSDDDGASLAVTADSGVAIEASRADHVHPLDFWSNADPQDTSTASASRGSSNEGSRADHVHKLDSTSITLLQTVAASDTGISASVETAANSKLVVRDNTSRIGALTVLTQTVKRASSGFLGLDGKTGVKLYQDGSELLNVTVSGGISTLDLSANSNSYIQNTSGSLRFRANAYMLLDAPFLGFRSADGFTDYMRVINSSTVPAPGDVQTIFGSMFGSHSGGIPTGQLRWYGKDLVWQHLSVKDVSSETKPNTMKRLSILQRKNIAIGTGAGTYLIQLIPAAEIFTLTRGRATFTCHIDWYDLNTDESGSMLIEHRAIRYSGVTQNAYTATIYSQNDATSVITPGNIYPTIDVGVTEDLLGQFDTDNNHGLRMAWWVEARIIEE